MFSVFLLKFLFKFPYIRRNGDKRMESSFNVMFFLLCLSKFDEKKKENYKFIFQCVILSAPIVVVHFNITIHD